MFGFVGSQWQQRVVGELDAALDRLKDSLPKHCSSRTALFNPVSGTHDEAPVHWEPKRADTTFFNQSGMLHTMFHHIRIMIHQPFYSSPRKILLSPHAYQSLVINVDAAHQCACILDTLRTRGSIWLPYHVVSAEIIR